jgi:CubicO group peptidase (beta-lactamase class C family)
MNKRFSVSFCCIVLFAIAMPLSGCREAKDSISRTTLKSLDGKAIPAPKMEAVVEQIMKYAGVAGLSCAVINDAKIVYVKAFGFRNKKQETRNDEETIFSAASLSKTVFACLVLKLAEKGKIDLDKPLAEYLRKPLDEYPKYADLKGDYRYQKISARIVLSHQTGFPNWRFLTEEGKLLFLFDPGARYSYSGEGVALLQMVVEEITGRGLEQLAREIVFDPLGMTRTSYVWKEEFEKNYAWPHDEFERPRMKERRSDAAAAGSMQTTAQDYARLLEDILQAKNLSRAAVKEMLIPQVAITSERMFGPGSLRETEANKHIHLSWCLGWGRFDSEHGRAFFHTGHEFGFQNYTVTYPDAGIGVVFLSNSDNFESVARKIVTAVIGPDESPFDWLGYPRFDPKTKKAPPPEPKAIEVEAGILADYLGDYEIQPGRIFSVKLVEGHLYISSEKDKWVEILPESETRFFVKDSDYVFNFKKDQGGKVTGIVLSLREIEIEGKKLK